MSIAEPQPAVPKQKLRWYQYRLRSLLVFVLFVSIALSGISWLRVKMQKAKRQRNAVETVYFLRGTVVYDFELDGAGNVVPGAVPPGLPSLRKLLGNDFFADVVRVSFNGSKVGDGELEDLKCLKRLQVMDLTGTNVTDEGVKKLQQELPNCKITR